MARGGKRERERRWRLKGWQAFLILIPLAFLAATLYRANHLKMVELKNAVMEADQEGDDERLEQALLNLADFTLAHTVISFIERNGQQEMVLGTGIFYMEGQYRRAAEAALARAQEEVNQSGNTSFGDVYRQVMATCDERARRYGWGYTAPYFNCIASELAKFPEAEGISNQLTADIPPAALYRISFASPLIAWEPVAPVIVAIIGLLIFILVRIFIFIISRLGARFLK